MRYVGLVCGMCRVQLCPIIPSAHSIIVDRLRGDYMYRPRQKSRSCSSPTRVPAALLPHPRSHFQVFRVEKWSTMGFSHPRRRHSSNSLSLRSRAALREPGTRTCNNTLRERSRT